MQSSAAWRSPRETSSDEGMPRSQKISSKGPAARIDPPASRSTLRPTAAQVRPSAAGPSKASAVSGRGVGPLQQAAAGPAPSRQKAAGRMAAAAASSSSMTKAAPQPNALSGTVIIHQPSPIINHPSPIIIKHQSSSIRFRNFDHLHAVSCLLLALMPASQPYIQETLAQLAIGNAAGRLLTLQHPSVNTS